MSKVKSYAALQADKPLHPHDINRRDINPDDVNIDILYCGVCHSDIHMARNEWNNTSIYPMVPGHEIIGIVKEVGSTVTKFKVGDNEVFMLMHVRNVITVIRVKIITVKRESF